MNQNQIISFFSSKGGVGKSTLILLVAYWYGRSGKRVLLLDSDAGGSVTQWDKKRRMQVKNDVPFTIADVEAFSVKARRSRADEREWDLILIDCPPLFDETGELTLKISDGIVTPLKLGDFDADRLAMMQSSEVFARCPKLVVINQVSYWNLEGGYSELERIKNSCHAMQCQYVILGDRKEFRQVARGIMPWDTRRFFRLFKSDFFDELDSLLKGLESLIR
jgi:cellulose biosynthesis protein BcsQ